MRFDNAFLTKEKKLGMQFVEGKVEFTAYEDKKGRLVVSDHATAEQKAKVVMKYHQLKGKYTPKTH